MSLYYNPCIYLLTCQGYESSIWGEVIAHINIDKVYEVDTVTNNMGSHCEIYMKQCSSSKNTKYRLKQAKATFW